MSLSLVLSGSLQYTGNNITLNVGTLSLTASVAGNGLNSENSVTVPTTAAAIPVSSLTGGAASGGWLYVKNLDPTNYMTLLTGTGGVAFATLLPGEFFLGRLAPGLTAPFWSAHTATVQATLAIFDI
jgi:hypothetical protein